MRLEPLGHSALTAQASAGVPVMLKPSSSVQIDIVLNQLTVNFPTHTKARFVQAVQNVSGNFMRGSQTAVVGPNGAGKSTLLSAIAGSLKTLPGAVQICPEVRDCVAWLPQQSAIDRSFPIQTFDLVAMGLWRQVGSFKALDAAQREKVQEALDAVRLGGCAQHNIGELSAGQFQRALFARVLLQDAQLILLDEPFNAVDARTTADLLAVVSQWHAQARTVIAVLHDLEQARRHFDLTLLLARRCVAWGPSNEALSSANLLRARQMSELWEGSEDSENDAAARHEVDTPKPKRWTEETAVFGSGS